MIFFLGDTTNFSNNDSLEDKTAVDPWKNKRCWIKAQIFAQRASSGAAGVKVLTGKTEWTG
jgi:hypothetical protein